MMPAPLYDRSNPLYAEICEDFELLRLLDLFGRELEKIGVIDDYLINLLGEKKDSLFSLKLRFVDQEFKPLEKAYFRYQFRLNDVYNINAKAFAQRRIVTINAESTAPEDRQALKLWKVEQISAIPFKSIKDYGEPAGTVVITKKQGEIPQHAFDAIQALIEIFYPVIRRAASYFYLSEKSQEFQQANEEQSKFLEFISEVSNLTDLQKIYSLFSKELARRVPFELFTYYLCEDDKLAGKNVTITADKYQCQYGEWAKFVIGTRYPTDNLVNPISHAFALNRHLLFEDVRSLLEISAGQDVKDWGETKNYRDQAEIRALLEKERTLLLVPIRQHDKPIGICALHSLSATVKVSEFDLRLIEHLSVFLGAAISNATSFAIQKEQNREIARLNALLQGQVSELSEQASIDQLTGLYNFRTYKAEVTRRLALCEYRGNQPGLAIAVVDIDHFKKFNDTYGHAAGNVVLAGVADEVNKLVRKSDLACRYGGEEFVVLLENCGADGILQFAERMRSAIEEARFPIEGAILSVTASIGCATSTVKDTPESLFERADQALYQAKHNGRNRVELKT